MFNEDFNYAFAFHNSTTLPSTSANHANVPAGISTGVGDRRSAIGLHFFNEAAISPGMIAEIIDGPSEKGQRGGGHVGCAKASG